MHLNMKRVIVKLSGEALGENGRLFDSAQIERTAKVLAHIVQNGTELGVVIGAGNIWRGRQGNHITAVTADQMGMLGTIINCLYMRDAVERAGAKACVMSAIEMPRVCETFSARRAIEMMKTGVIVFFAGGSGNPFFTTDTAVVLRAIETEADAILLAKNIDGVYDSDPRVNPNAKLIKEISYQKAEEMRLRVMDTAAFALCADHFVPMVRVFGLSEPENIQKVLDGDDMGTKLYSESDIQRV